MMRLRLQMLAPASARCNWNRRISSVVAVSGERLRNAANRLQLRMWPRCVPRLIGAEYVAINRWGVVPTLRHRGLTILQSNVILDYLARETGHFEGRTEQQRWQAGEWLSWEADHITYIAKVRHSARFRPSHPETIAEYRPRAEAALSFVDKTVENQPFLVGDYCTIADIGCWGRMVFMAEGGFDITRWPHLEAWAGRLAAMPG